MRPPPRPPLRRSVPHEWRELTLTELQWAHVAMERCGLVRGRGRPAFFDHVQRLEACLEACVRRMPWGAAVTAAAPGMKPDTLRRCFLRWSRAGLWKEMLRLMRFAGAPSGAMEWFVCMAYRRAWRVQGLRGIVLARECGFASALRVPPEWLPDPVLSASWLRGAARLARGLPFAAAHALFRASTRILWGPARVPRAAKAGW